MGVPWALKSSWRPEARRELARSMTVMWWAGLDLWRSVAKVGPQTPVPMTRILRDMFGMDMGLGLGMLLRLEICWNWGKKRYGRMTARAVQRKKSRCFRPMVLAPSLFYTENPGRLYMVLRLHLAAKPTSPFGRVYVRRHPRTAGESFSHDATNAHP